MSTIPKSLPKILIVQTGTVGPLAEAHGDYPAWFRRSLEADAQTTPVLLAHEGERLDANALFSHGASGILVTGSPLSMTQPAPWMEDLAGELHRAGKRGVPVLGICFGHQLLAHGAGTPVVKNPRGREIGTVEVQLTEDGARDPLFAWTRTGGADPSWARDCEHGRIAVQATHVDAVSSLPEGAVLLASNESTPMQALRYSETVASTQFHPEIDPAALRALIASRTAPMASEGLDAAALARGVRETQSGLVLRAFVEQVRRA